MYIHNKRKRVVLWLINSLIDLIILPFRVFFSKIDFSELKPGKILLIRLDHIGDVIMTTPSLTQIRTHFPDSKVILLANTAAAQLFSGDGRVDEVLTFNWRWLKSEKRTQSLYAQFRALSKLILYLRRQKIDLMIDFRGDLRFLILFGVLTGIKIKISNSRTGNRSLLDFVAPYDIDKHEVERSLAALDCFRIKNKVIRPSVALTDLELGKARRVLAKETNGHFPEKIVVVAPFSSQDIKSWPGSSLSDVIRYLQGKKFVVLITGAPNEAQQADALIRGLGSGVISLAGKTTLKEMAALLSLSALVIGIDTGTLHLAACFDVPAIAIFGPTRSVEFRPYSPYVNVIDNHSCVCNQHLHLECKCSINGYAKCMNDISVSSVIHEINKILYKTASLQTMR